MSQIQNSSLECFRIKIIIPFILFVLVLHSCKTIKEEEPPIVWVVPPPAVQANQSEPEHESEAVVFTIVDEMPEFPEGNEGLSRFLSENLTYPEKARYDGVEGTVFVSFVVSKNGKVQNPQLLRGVSPELDAECIRVIEAMPDWKPGKKNGEPVRVRFTIPMRFGL